MKKLKAFTKLDLMVVIGLILVLFGASLTMLGKTLNQSKDQKNLEAAGQVMNYLKKYRDSNFGLYPTAKIEEGVQVAYRFAALGNNEADANFLKIELGSKYSSFIEKVEDADNLVYVYKADGSEAAVVVRKLYNSSKECNTESAEIPEIISQYLIQDPTACYYIDKNSP